jgi:hypothetical protein
MKPAILAAALLFSTLAAAQPATTIGEAPLRSAPLGDAGVVATLPANSTVEIVGRQGGWYQVKAAAQSGWLRLSSLRLPPSASNTAVAYSGSGRGASTGAVATTGVRGLSETDIANAQPNYAAVDQLAAYAADRPGEDAFAAKLGLQSRSVPPLPERAP